MLSWLFPTYCAVCREEGATLCSSCARELREAPRSQRCIYCSLALTHGELCSTHQRTSHFSNLYTIFRYRSSTIRKILEQYKYHNRPQLAHICAGAMETFLRQHTILPASTIIVPIPSPAKRHGERSYTPTVLLAKALGKCLHLPSLSLLRCTRNPRKQATLNRQERRQNVEALFALQIPPKCLDGKTILLVDDVITTGSTMEEAAKTIGPQSSIYGITFAQNT